MEKTKQDHLAELESKQKDIEFLENQLKTHKNTLKESNADSKAQLKKVLKRYQAETIANSNKIKGHLISKGLFGVIVSTKKPTKLKTN